MIFILCLNVNLILGQVIVKRQIFPTNLETYQGTWEYISGNEVFRVYLQIGRKDTEASFGPGVIGDYFYSKNSVACKKLLKSLSLLCIMLRVAFM